MPTAVNFVREFMSVLGIERASIAGNSMGGMVALRTAVEFPELVDRLVLVDAAGLGREVAWFIRAMSLPVVGELMENPTPRNTRMLLKRVFYNPGLVQESLIREILPHKRDTRVEASVLEDHPRINRLAGNSFKVDNGG